MTVAQKLQKSGVKPKSKRHKKPLWKGPFEDGITFSYLSRFLVCRERFRLLMVEGLRPVDTFNHRIEYGQMWHVCEEAYAKIEGKKIPQMGQWQFDLRDYTAQLCQQYQTQQGQINHWYQVCKAQFPIYVDHWKKHPDTKRRVPLFQEEVFNVPYKLPSGRVVRLRGKWDSVNCIGRGKAARVYLQENKTRGEIKEDQIQRQLQFDFQTMFYLIALGINKLLNRDAFPMGSLGGVKYNLVRRPLSGGKHSIRQHKPSKANPSGESEEDFYVRLAGLIAEEPEHYFMRWKIDITSQDINKFLHDFLNPILEQLCDWWEWLNSPLGRKDPFADHLHWRTPYGFYNVLAEGGSTELDEYLATGSTLGLEQVDNLFPELMTYSRSYIDAKTTKDKKAQTS